MVKRNLCSRLTNTACKLRKHSKSCKLTVRRNKGKRNKGRKSYCRTRKKNIIKIQKK